jgi:hypothetical protein
MGKSLPFRLNRSGMLLALISAGFAGEAAAAAGRVDFATSGVTVAGRDGQQRPLARGAELDTGDTVRTGADGRAQIRFTDGSYVSLQPNTDFAISDYKYDGRTDGSERGFYGLVRGAMRTVTGAIGRVNRNAYRVTTPTATVGIRGTGGVIQVLNDGSTLVIGTSGIWSLTNPAGSIDVPAGVSGLAPTEPNTPPRETNTQPQTSTAPVQPEQPGFVQGEQVNPDGTAQIVEVAGLGYVPLVSGDGYAPAIAVLHPGFSSFNSILDGGDGGEGAQVGSAMFDEKGQLTELTLGSNMYKLGPAGAHRDFGSDGILAWGRWVGEVTMAGGDCGGGGCTTNFGENQGFHYVIGMPTPVMPTFGIATYAVMGATSPTYVNGQSAPGTFSGSLSVHFGADGPNFYSISGSFSAAMADRTYNWSAGSGSSGPFWAMFANSGLTTGCANSGGCSVTMTGFFSGSAAERAGMSYKISDTVNVVGAAAFKQTSIVAPPPPQ